jgi:hypothetical protein
MAEAAKALALPTPAEIDELAIRFDKKKTAVLDATLAQRAAAEELEKVKQECVDLVGKFGSQHVQKSKLLHGAKWEIMGTFGTFTSTDAAAVERLRLLLVEKSQTRLLKRLFASTVRWTLRSTARAEILKPGVDDDIRSSFAVCEVTKDKSPTIEARPLVRPAYAEPSRGIRA